ncbi:MAG: cytochrome C oxidase subunit IV family protein, partial [Lentisphaeraceae bacterium]|nr:cytochrome C oxidase subunit IV family protein [Lentisphaeraceae bacterium]
FGVGGALLVLTFVTVWTAKFMPEMITHVTKMTLTPTLSIIIALVIASIKASLVCLFFMHLKYDKPLNRLAFISGVFFLSLFFIFTLADVLTRADTPTAAVPELSPSLTPDQRAKVLKTYATFKDLTERPPTPVWVEAWDGFDAHGNGPHHAHGHSAETHAEPAADKQAEPAKH